MAVTIVCGLCCQEGDTLPSYELSKTRAVGRLPTVTYTKSMKPQLYEEVCFSWSGSKNIRTN